MKKLLSWHVAPPQTGACLVSLLTLAIVLAVGFLCGVIVTTYALLRQQPIAIIEDGASDIPVVRIEGIRDGALKGTARGTVRVTAGDEVIPVDQSGAFVIRDRTILTNIVTITAPTGMRFVASKRGTKFYPIASSEAQGIVPENRVYFPDDASARRAGYVR